MRFSKLVNMLAREFNRRTTEIYSILGEFMVKTNDFTKPYSMNIGGKKNPHLLKWDTVDGWDIQTLTESTSHFEDKLKINEG